MKKYWAPIIASLAVVAGIAGAQEKVLERGDSTVIVVPNPDYLAGSAHRFVFGDTWRDLWATPVRVPILDFDTFAGGLTILRRGGGMQTRSLRLLGADGKYYKFRSIRKFTDKYLPEELKKTLAEEVIMDMFATINPYSAILSAPIVNAAGILQATPTLCYLPDSEVLGEYREEYGGLLGTIEEHPQEYDADDLSFGDADKVFGTFKLYEDMLDDNDYRVDGAEYLKARLIDIYLGDWDRHYDQWRWAVYKQGKSRICKPIPRDRDQAFCAYDGVFNRALELAIPQTNDFKSHYQNIEFLTWSGRYLDRKFLPPVDRKTWDSVANFLQSTITNELIDSALHSLPPEVVEDHVKRLRSKMISRRDNLKNISDDFYELINKFVDIRGGDKDEYVLVDRHPDGSTEITIYKRGKDGPKLDELLFRKTFDRETTSEIRLLLFDDDDIVILNGKVERGIDVRVDAGDGPDDLVDNSSVEGLFFGFLPFVKPYSRATFFYDSGKKTDLELGPSSVIYRKQYPEPKNDTAFFEPPVRDYGSEKGVWPWGTVNSDYGVFGGGGPIITKYGFKSDPYLYRFRGRVGISLLLGGFKGDFRFDLPDAIWGLDLRTRLYGTQIDVARFYGFGNESKVRSDDDGIDYDYYRIYLDYAYFEPTLVFGSGNLELILGGKVKVSSSRAPENSLAAALNPYGTGKMSILSGIARLNYDSRNDEFYPKRGLFAEIEADFASDAFSNDEPFAVFSAELRTYKTIEKISKLTLAAMLFGEKNIGKEPYFESAFLGGYETLRGFSRNRFAGDAAVGGSVETRFKLSDYRLVVPGEFGMSVFSDFGRVFLDGENSDEIRYSYGGGIWASAVEDKYVATAYLANTIERISFYAGLGFRF